jgi:23S rRNA (guanosine2251-2'-O)-methyltransferase
MLTCNFHSIEESLQLSGCVRQIWMTEPAGPRVRKIVENARLQRVPISVVDKKKLQHMVQGQDSRGIVAELVSSEAQAPNFNDLIDELSAKIKRGLKPLVLVLDGITDPHNLGAIIRSADKFSVDAIIVPARRSAGDGPVVHAASAGAVQYVPLVTVTNLARALEELKTIGIWVWAADMNGSGVHTLDATIPLALILGAEGRGIGRLLGENADFVCSIPTGGHVDSLNVSVAAGIVLYEISRQRNFQFFS